MEKKKLVELLGSIFVALIFLTSYAAFGNTGGGGGSATTTVAQQQTVYATARGVANIISYGSVLDVNISCSNTTNVSAMLNSVLTELEKNGSVSNFYAQQAGQILVQAGSVNSTDLFRTLSQDINGSSNCTSFESSANIQLPNSMNFYIPDQKKSGYIITIPGSLQSYTLPIVLTQNMISRVNVSVSGLLAANGSIYGSLVVRQV